MLKEAIELAEDSELNTKKVIELTKKSIVHYELAERNSEN